MERGLFKGDWMQLIVSMAQMEVLVSEPAKNLERGEAWIAEAAKRGSDLICFPEMWTTGFNWAANRRMAQEHEKIIERIAEMASRYHIWINGSMLALNEEGKIANTSILFNPSGQTVGIYRKTHLFSYMHENEHMTAGLSLCIAETPWGPIGLSICYDIRFPELFRTYALKGVKMVLSPMAFPYPRLEHWKILVRARAIENQMYMIGTNQVGTEDFGPDGLVTYFGSSVIVDPWGETVIEAGNTSEALLTVAIDMDHVDKIRGRMKVFEDRRPELYDL